jgi:ferredoxin
MTQPQREAAVVDVAGLARLVQSLRAGGRTVVAPTVRDGALVYGEIESLDDLPRGVGDLQEPAGYRLRRRDDEALFGYAAPAISLKPWFLPARSLLWRGERTADGFIVEAEPPPARPLALVGVRGCDLAAVAVHDRVLRDRVGARPAADRSYSAARSDVLVVAASCAEPAGTCFCSSMGTGPAPGDGADLALTELVGAAAARGGHRFVVEVRTALGAAALAAAGLPVDGASEQDRAAAAGVVDTAATRMGRHLDTDGLRDVLYAGAEDPEWDRVAARCLTCASCTLACPTCFCTTVEDTADLTGAHAERWRVWDSCFTPGFSYVHGGSVRESARSRYRQWMTHKLATWVDQFGTSGCVGCGRCITWCPVGIDITQEAAAIRENALDSEPVP